PYPPARSRTSLSRPHFVYRPTMRRAIATSALSTGVLLITACHPDVVPPPRPDRTTTRDPATTPTSSTSTTAEPEPAQPPRLDFPYPDLPGPTCEQRLLADQCLGSCNEVPPPGTIAEVCNISAPGAPAPFHRLLVDCACDDSRDLV